MLWEAAAIFCPELDEAFPNHDAKIRIFSVTAKFQVADKGCFQQRGMEGGKEGRGTCDGIAGNGGRRGQAGAGEGEARREGGEAREKREKGGGREGARGGERGAILVNKTKI